MKNRNKIDDLFREAMTGYRVEPSLGLWLRIERRFFPPSKLRPTGLITSILLLVVAGLMPWLLIPAHDQAAKEPNLPVGKLRQGYLIQTTSQDLRQDKNNLVHGRTFSVKPTVYLDNSVYPADDTGMQFLASINDPTKDPAMQPILSAFQHDYYLAEQHENSGMQSMADRWMYHMSMMNFEMLSSVQSYDRILDYRSGESQSSAFSPDYENDYVRKTEISTGLNFVPSIVFYDPNPYNKMLGAEAVVHFKLASFSIMSGLGFSRMQDVGSYRINYMTNDSIGYYMRVVSFIPDPRNPGDVTYIVIEEPIYDSIPHYTITDKTNYYSYIDIPLSFGYTFFQKRRISLTASVGVKFSVLVGKNEPTVDFHISDAELIDIERQVPARMNTNWRFTAGVDFGYLFTDRFSLHLEPIFEQYISPIYAREPGFKPKKPNITGLKAGIRYNF